MSRLPLLCFPFAGSGASFFMAWGRIPAARLELMALQLAGREDRFEEEPHRDVATAVGTLLPELVEALKGHRQVALFGHSLGAVLAYETAQRLTATRQFQVARLFVSGSPGPWTRRTVRATGLSENEFLERVQELAGYRHPSLDHPELRELILPALRADVEMHESYWPVSDRLLDAPITAIRGLDDELVSRSHAEEWAGATSAGFRLVELPGGHMYLTESMERLLEIFEEELAVGTSS